MATIVIIILVVAFFVIILPLMAMSRASEAARHGEELSKRVASLERRLKELQSGSGPEPIVRREPGSTRSPAPDLAGESSTIGHLKTRFARPEPPPPTVVRVPASQPSVSGTKPQATTPPLPAQKAPVFTRQASSPSPFEKIQWEQFMGVRLFAWLGGFALFLAAAFFVKYSFDRGLIPPAIRVTIGFAVGAGLLVGGIRMSRKKYKITADTLSATGVVILYSVTFACRAVYHFGFFQPLPTFVVMACVTTIAFLLSVRMNAMVVAILGMLGGFLTPILVSTGEDNPFGLFTYVALLDIGLIAVAFAMRWNWLSFSAAICTMLMQMAWVAAQYAPSKIHTAMIVFIGFCVLFAGSSLWMRRRERSDVWMDAASLVLPASTFLFTGFLIVTSPTSPAPWHLFVLLLGADLAVVCLSISQAKLRCFHQIGGGIVFVLLALWTALLVDDQLLFWALGGYFGFAVLHTAVPVILFRRNPAESVTPWAHAFPVISLILAIIPMLRLEMGTLVLWPFVLLVTLLSIALAIITASIGAILITVLATALVAFLWLWNLPVDPDILPDALLVLGAYAVVFTVVGVIAGGVILDRQRTQAINGDGLILPPSWLPQNARLQIPALGAILPFLLLMLLTAKLPIAQPSALFGTAMGLGVLMLGLTRAFRMDWLPAVGLGCTFLLEYLWHAQRFSPPAAGVTVSWYLGFYALYLAFPFLLLRGKADCIVTWSTAALAGPAQFFLVHRLTAETWPNEFMGLLPAAFSLPAFGALADLLRKIPARHPARNTVLAWFGGVALLFITLIFPIQFDRQWLTIGWAFEGAALLWLFSRIPHHGLRHAGVGLLAVSFIRLALNQAVLGYSPRSEIPILNWYLYSYGCVTGALFLGGKLLKKPDHRLFGKDARPLLVTLGAILAFLLVNIEIADFFSEPGTRRLTFDFSGNFARDMTYTIGWALFAFVLLLIGILRNHRAGRWAGIGLLSATLLKLFLHDLATLNQLYRVGALVGVAVIAIVVSFLYQKFLSGQTTGGTTTDDPEAPSP